MILHHDHHARVAQELSGDAGVCGMSSIGAISGLSARVALGLVALGVLACVSHANTSPTTPTILEPTGTRPLSPSDVHMETAPFVDADPGQVHECSDWEIWDVVRNERVWFGECKPGVLAVHIHLGDGIFQNTLNGFRELEPERQYRFRVRHKDNSNSPNAWSAWSQRDFVTGARGQVYAMSLNDIAAAPQPIIRQSSGQQVQLPAGVSYRIEAVCCQSVLLNIRGTPQGNALTNPSPMAMHMDLAGVITAGASGTSLPPLDVEFEGGDGVFRAVLFPALTLGPGESRAFWIATDGSTFVVEPGQTEPTFTTPARRNKAPWVTTPDMKVSVFAENLRLPVNIAFVPNPGPNPTDPFLYVTELYGDIKVVSRNGTVGTFASNLLNFDPVGGFPGSGEIGLAGLVVDPSTGDVYASMVYDTGSNGANKVDRFTSIDGGRTAATRTTVLDLAPFATGPSHQISDIRIVDGLLYVNVGDGLIITTPQDLDDPRGKVLRVSLQGQAIPSNPFYNAGDGISVRDMIYSLGYRNPFGGALRRQDMRQFIVENGPGIDRFSELVAGRNMGFDGSDFSMTQFALHNWIPSNAPVDVAFVEPLVFANSGFPSEYAGRAYVTLSGGTWTTGPGVAGDKTIQEFLIDPNGVLLDQPRIVARYEGTGKASASAIAAGPDGIYFADLYRDDSLEDPTARGAQVLRLAYAPPADCNANGVPDVQDLAAGTSTDCNANQVPDECDLANGWSTDCDRNNQPDECQTVQFQLATFDAGPAPMALAGDAQWLAPGFIRLDPTPGNGFEGAINRGPVRAFPARYLLASFDFRMGGDLGGKGIAFVMFDATRWSTSAIYPDAGLPSECITVRLRPGPTPTTGFVDLLRDRIKFATKLVPMALGDGQTRRVQFVYSGAGFTVRVRDVGQPWTIVHRSVPLPDFAPFVAGIGVGAEAINPGAWYEVDNLNYSIPNASDIDGDFLPDGQCLPEGPVCDDLDFNNDAIEQDPTDLEAFLSVYSGGPCVPATATCNDVDFNNDGIEQDPTDIEAFLSVYSGGPCF